MQKKRHILLIEYHPQIRDVLKINLESWGFSVWEAMNGIQGLELLQAGCKPDIVVSDMLMRGSSGIETFAEIKALYPEIRLVVLSGGSVYKGQTDFQRAQGIGADAILEKPFDMETLEKTVRGLVV